MNLTVPYGKCFKYVRVLKNGCETVMVFRLNYHSLEVWLRRKCKAVGVVAHFKLKDYKTACLCCEGYLNEL
jgi:uncharacterized membrane protein